MSFRIASSRAGEVCPANPADGAAAADGRERGASRRPASDSRRRAAPAADVLVHVLVLASLVLGGCVPRYEARLRAHREAGDLAAAEQLLDASLRIAPADAALCRERGILALERGHAATAIPLLEQALGAEPDDARAAFYLALAHDTQGDWQPAVVRYRRFAALSGPLSPELEALLIRQQRAVEARRTADRLERAIAGEPPAPRRILFLPFDMQIATPLAQSMRLGLAAVLIEDWKAVPSAEPVPLDEVLAFMQALGVEHDAALDDPTRERLAILTGATHVVHGRISESTKTLVLEPRITDRLTTDPERRLVRLEYLRGRPRSLLDLEKTILFRTARQLEVELTEARVEALRRFATESPVALELFGEALGLIESGQVDAARERIARAVVLDPDFRLATELQAELDPVLPPAVPGEVARLRFVYERDRRLAEQAALRADMLAGTNDHVGLGGPEGESVDLSINRPAAAGSAAVLIHLPR
ncbi:MAG: hypothetical protein PVF43_03855 [Candidatus Eiseniibacteriota bacterium]